MLEVSNDSDLPSCWIMWSPYLKVYGVKRGYTSIYLISWTSLHVWIMWSPHPKADVVRENTLQSS